MLRPLIVLALCFIFGCSQTGAKPENKDEVAIKKIQQDYVNGWLGNNETAVLSLFEDDALIQPSSLCPMDGLQKIRQFWFPKDGSITTINHFEIKLLYVHVENDTAISSGLSFLDWSYKKDTTAFSMSQKGVETTIYLRRANNKWMIWRQMWTDLYAKRN